VARSPIKRPAKKTDFTIQPVTRAAEKGWMDLVATARNAAAEAWDFLTAHPTLEGGRCYQLKGAQAVVVIDGTSHQRWQYKPTGGGRIWYAVKPAAKQGEDNLVLPERVTTGHPNETAKHFR
jgi:hypothetical protein